MATILFPYISLSISEHFVTKAKNLLHAGKIYNNLKLVKINHPIPNTEVKTYLPSGPKFYKIQSIKKVYDPPTTMYIGGGKGAFAAFPVNLSLGEWKIKYNTILSGMIDMNIPDLPIDTFDVSESNWDNFKVNKHNRDTVIDELKLNEYTTTLPNKFNLKLYQASNIEYYIEDTEYKRIHLSQNKDKLLDNMVDINYPFHYFVIGGLGLWTDIFMMTNV